ncbi:MAG: hypothetical protein RL204_798 [Bacteroidota bacterium]|jgi:hypothetical protein
MTSIKNLKELKEEIAFLQSQQAQDFLALKVEAKKAYTSLKPVNFLNDTLKDLSSSPEFKGNLMNSTIGIGAGFITKKLVLGATHNPIKQFLGTLLQIGVTSLVSRNGDSIKSGVSKLISRLR